MKKKKKIGRKRKFSELNGENFKDKRENPFKKVAKKKNAP